jgi:hypothetical protein
MKGLTTDELEQKVKTMTHAAGMYFSFVCSKYHHSDFTKEETKVEEGKRAPAEPDAEKRARLETEFVLQKKLLRTFRAVASGDIAFPMLDDDVVRYAMNHKAFNGAYYTYLESKGDRIKQNAQDKLTAQERGKKEVTPSLKEFAASSTGAEEGAGEGEQDGSSTAEVVADDDEGIQGLLRPASQSAVA